MNTEHILHALNKLRDIQAELYKSGQRTSAQAILHQVENIEVSLPKCKEWPKCDCAVQGTVAHCWGAKMRADSKADREYMAAQP